MVHPFETKIEDLKCAKSNKWKHLLESPPINKRPSHQNKAPAWWELSPHRPNWHLHTKEKSNHLQLPCLSSKKMGLTFGCHIFLAPNLFLSYGNVLKKMFFWGEAPWFFARLNFPGLARLAAPQQSKFVSCLPVSWCFMTHQKSYVPRHLTTPPKTKMEPENHPFVKENPFVLFCFWSCSYFCSHPLPVLPLFASHSYSDSFSVPFSSSCVFFSCSCSILFLISSSSPSPVCILILILMFSLILLLLFPPRHSCFFHPKH